jgi:carboxyl-terminal processing protease
MVRQLELMLLAVLCTGIAAAQPLTDSQRQANLDSFEHAWKTVLEKHWDPKINGLDWQAIHDELRPKVEAAGSTEEARAIIAGMLDRLHQTHFGVFPASVYKDLDASTGGEGNPGIDLRVIDGRALVTEVVPGSPAATQGVKTGWEILRFPDAEIDVATLVKDIQATFKDSSLLELRLARTVLARLTGTAGSKVRVVFLDGAEHRVSLELERVKPRGVLARLGNMPASYVFAEWSKPAPDIGYVHFSEFMAPETVNKTMEEAMKACRDCRGIVIDVRGNPGGIGGLAMGVAGWFVGTSGQKLGVMHTRTTNLNFVIFPRPETFDGPVAILVDGLSASTSEIFAGGLQDLHRARIFGSRTAAAALPSIIERLPNNDGFQYAFANYISEGGKPLEGVGVIPDEEVRPTRQQLLNGRDPALDAAMAWIHQQKK